MILFFEYGRLGNQLFQYNGLKNYFPKHKLIFFGCASLQKTFENIDASFIEVKNVLDTFLFRILKNFLYFFSSIRILGQINESLDNKYFKLNVRKGFFFNIYVARNIYFQNDECIKKIISQPILKKKYLKYAKNWLKKKKIFTKNSNLVFVHIRRGDYLSWPDANYPAVVDLYWYKKAMLNIKKKIKKSIFILMGDDTFYLQDSFKETKSLIISKNSYRIDLSIMSLCSHGILSPSSFAWWGAFLSTKKNKLKTYFIAKKFWAGHRLKKWYPSKITSDWFIYL